MSYVGDDYQIDAPEEVDLPIDPPDAYKPPDEKSPSQHRRERRIGRVGLIILGLILVPIAAAIGGFCCCWAGLAVTSSIGGWLGGNSMNLVFIGWGIGLLLGAALAFRLLAGWWSDLG